jgi:hypothetical protein
MARDATLVPNFNRESLLNYTPALAQAILDYGQVAVHLKLPIAFGTADAATLFTVPSGLKLSLVRCYWEVTTTFAGGSSSAIGVSSANTAYSTKGDILGGASGDVAAMLVSTGSPYKGTLGPKILASAGTTSCVVLVAADILRFDRVTSAFTSGAGFVHVDGFLVD